MGYLCKMSIDRGVPQKVYIASVNEARDIMHDRHVCDECLDEFDYSFTNENNKKIIFKPSLGELLSTGCGLEWEYYETDKEYDDFRKLYSDQQFEVHS